MAAPYAFVTLLTSDSYLPGALALAAALKDLHPRPPTPPEVDFQTVCLVTPQSVDVSSIKLLRRAFGHVIGVEPIERDLSKELSLLGRPDLKAVLTKLHAFRLTQYSRIIFLDADVLPVKPMSHLFTLPHEFSAVPDVGWPDIFNSGVMVFSPKEGQFDELQELLDTKGSWDGGDQGILNEWRTGNWNKLSFTYNTTPNAAYTYAPAYERFGPQISAIHFIGPDKPWHSIPWRAPQGSTAAPSQPDVPSPPSEQTHRTYDYPSLVDKWYDVYDRHYRSETVVLEPQFDVASYTPAWDEPSEGATQAGGNVRHATSVLDLEDLKRLAIEGMSATTAAAGIVSGEGDYTSMPLGGRLDLMPPKKEQDLPRDVHHIPSSMHHAPSPMHIPSSTHHVPSSTHHHVPSFMHHVPSSPQHAPSSSQDVPSSSQDVPSFSQDVPLSSQDVPSSSQHVPLTMHQVSSSMRRQSHPPTEDSTQLEPHPSPRLGGSPPGQSPPLPSPEAHAHDLQRSVTPVMSAPSDVHFDDEPPEAPRPGVQSLPSTPTATPSRQQYRLRPDLGTPLQVIHSSFSPPRPSSPPLLSWNPSVEPPPTAAPPTTFFPEDTYFPNVWDQRRPEPNETSPAAPEALFEVPPPSDIPEALLRQGHYRNVTGTSDETATPSPDRSKVKPLFPWEHRPRHLPGRVFPETDTPPPGAFLPSDGGSPSTSPERHGGGWTGHATPSPLAGLPATFSFLNAWDTVPSIQRYAFRLGRPPAAPASPLGPAFEGSGRRRSGSRKAREDRVEVGSRDGDVSGEEEESEDEVQGRSGQHRSRSGSLSSSSLFMVRRGKEYKSRGVQTTTREMRSKGVQVRPVVVLQPGGAPPISQEVPRPQSMVPRPGVRPSTPEVAARGPAPSLSTLVSEDRVTHRPVSPLSLQEPSLPPRQLGEQQPPRTTPSLAASTVDTSPVVTARGTIDGNDTSSLASPPSSVGPLSPPDARAIVAPPQRKGKRVWDPARGVEVFKRGSEEAWAKFLRMGSWDEDGAARRA